MSNNPNNQSDELEAILVLYANSITGNFGDKINKIEAKQAINQLIKEAYKKGYIDGGIAEITK